MDYIETIRNDNRLNFGFDETNYIFYDELVSKKGQKYEYIQKNNIDINTYSSHSPSCCSIYEVIKGLDIKNTDSILDIGSGKGFALVIFSLFDFKTITGVEINENDYLISLNNLEKLNIHQRVNVKNQDIIHFPNLDEYNHFYFYNPFGSSMFNEIITKIVFYCKSGFKIIYKNIHCEEETILLKHNIFLSKKICGNDRDYYIYEKL